MTHPRSGRRRTLERRVRATLRPLDVPSPLNVPELCDRVSRARGRPLVAVGRKLPVPGPTGLWIARRDTDEIHYQSQTSVAHQNLIVLHELGHIVAGHSSDRGEPSASEPELSDLLISELFPDLPPEFVRSTLRRESYDDAEEFEAEMFGTIVLNWAGRIDHTMPPAASSPEGRRVQDSLGSRLGWR